MISREEIRNLAELARLELREDEVAPLQKDISAILDYIGQVSAVSQGDALKSGLSKASPLLHSVMRGDTPQAVSEEMRERLLAAAPRREGDYVVVRKVIEKDE